jgi:hypothetical protein
MSEFKEIASIKKRIRKLRVVILIGLAVAAVTFGFLLCND